MGATVGRPTVDPTVEHHHLAVHPVEGAQSEVAMAQHLVDGRFAVIAASQQAGDSRRPGMLPQRTRAVALLSLSCRTLTAHGEEGLHRPGYGIISTARSLSYESNKSRRWPVVMITGTSQRDRIRGANRARPPRRASKSGSTRPGAPGASCLIIDFANGGDDAYVCSLRYPLHHASGGEPMHRPEPAGRTTRQHGRSYLHSPWAACPHRPCRSWS